MTYKTLLWFDSCFLSFLIPFLLPTSLEILFSYLFTQWMTSQSSGLPSMFPFQRGLPDPISTAIQGALS